MSPQGPDRAKPAADAGAPASTEVVVAVDGLHSLQILIATAMGTRQQLTAPTAVLPTVLLPVLVMLPVAMLLPTVVVLSSLVLLPALVMLPTGRATSRGAATSYGGAAGFGGAANHGCAAGRGGAAVMVVLPAVVLLSSSVVLTALVVLLAVVMLPVEVVLAVVVVLPTGRATSPWWCYRSWWCCGAANARAGAATALASPMNISASFGQGKPMRMFPWTSHEAGNMFALYVVFALFISRLFVTCVFLCFIARSWRDWAS